MSYAQELRQRKYLIHPGWVTSHTDGDEHYITARQLIKLYGVAVSECVVCRDCQRGMSSTPCTFRSFPGGWDLFPDPSGEYKMPISKERRDTATERARNRGFDFNSVNENPEFDVMTGKRICDE